MDFDLTDDQRLLRGSLNQLLVQRYDFDARVRSSRSGPGYRTEIWDSLASDLGLFGLMLPRDAGGFGGGGAEQLVVMQEVGRFLMLEPIAETIFQGGWLLQKAGGPFEAIRETFLEGRVRLALAIGEPSMRYDYEDIAASAERSDDGWTLAGEKSVVAGAPWADFLIVAARSAGVPGDRGGLSLFLVPAAAEGVGMTPYPTIDGRRAADVRLTGVRVSHAMLVGAEGQGLDLLEELRDRATAAQVAEASGILERLMDDTLEYTKQRAQFGKPIATFQVLQHRMVDMYLQVELTRAAALLGSLRLDAPPNERAAAVSAAKVTTARACRFVGQNAVQLHGAMGMTDGLAVGHYFKRATQIELEFGSADWHLDRRSRLEAAAPACRSLEHRVEVPVRPAPRPDRPRRDDRLVG